MKTYLALFRGINIGGHHALPMKGLVEILSGLGCENVKTYIQSGNVVFRIKGGARPEIAATISQRVLEGYGFAPQVFLLDAADLQEAVAHNPFATGDGKAVHFFFMESAPGPAALERLAVLKSKSEEFKLHKKILYLYAPEGVGRSKLAANAEQILRVPVTARNWNTVRKLMALAEDID